MIVMPALTPGMEEGLLSRWRIKPGDVVAVGDVVAEVETDKAVIELPAAAAGVIEEICVPEGTAGVRVDTLLARIKGAGEPALASTALPESAEIERTTRGFEEIHATAPATGGKAGAEITDATLHGAGHRKLASPLARRLARERNLELGGIAGSGPGGRVVKRDVEAAVPDRRIDDASSPVCELAALAELHALGIEPGSYDLLPLDGMRRTIAARTTIAFRDVPHFPLTVHLCVDELLALRAKINAACEPKISVNDLLIKASALALVHVPAANASYTPAGIARHRHADIAFAVALEEGLITPIVRAAESRTVASIAAETRELAELARQRRLQPAQFQGGTFTLSNLGMFGIHSFGSILNPPHGCILSVGAIERRVVVVHDRPSVASMLTVTLTCDHRVVDGVVGARWLAAFKELVESPAKLAD